MKRLFGKRTPLASAVLAVGADDKKDDAAKEMKKLEGTWQQVSQEAEGQKGPEEFIQKQQLIIKGDKSSILTKGEVVNPVYTFTIDRTKKPKTWDSTRSDKPGKKTPNLAIYELEGDTLKISSSISESIRKTSLPKREAVTSSPCTSVRKSKRQFAT